MAKCAVITPWDRQTTYLAIVSQQTSSCKLYVPWTTAQGLMPQHLIVLSPALHSRGFVAHLHLESVETENQFLSKRPTLQL